MLLIRRKLSGRDHARHQIYEGPEADHRLVVASSDRPELLDFREIILDLMPPFVHLLVMVTRVFPVRFRRNHGRRAARVEIRHQPVGVEGLVADQCPEIHALQKRRRSRQVVGLARKELEADQVAQRVDQRHDLGRQASPGSPDRLRIGPPFPPDAFACA